MGNRNYKISKWHFLHYYNIKENKIIIFDVETEIVHCYPLIKDDYPFFPGYMNSISIESNGLIYFIGGIGFKQTPAFNYNMNVNNDGENEEYKFYDEKILKDTNVETKEELYATTFKTIGDMEALDWIGYLDLNNFKTCKLNLNYLDIDQLPCNLYGHSLFYENKYIYIIGGFHDQFKTNKNSYRFNIESKILEEIEAFNSNYSFDNAGGFIDNNYLYIFDTKSRKQKIHKYSIESNSWEVIELVTNDFKIPFTINPTIFKYDSENYIYLNGLGDDKGTFIDYYFFNIEKEEFTSLRTDRKLNKLDIDRQGTKNYEDSLKIFGSMNSKELKYYDKSNFIWYSIPLSEFNFRKERGCLG